MRVGSGVQSAPEIFGKRQNNSKTYAAENDVCYFEPDARKAGGAYRRKNGRLRQLDTVARVLRFDDGSCVPLDRVRELASERF